MAADTRPPPRALIFDWDNTLVDNWISIHEAINATFAAMGHPPWTLAETRRNVRRSLRDSFPGMFGDRWEEARRVFYRHIAESHLETLKALPGAGETLAALAGAGLYLGVVSNKRGDLLRREAEHLGWDRHFGQIVGAADAAADKPAVAPVEMALAGSGIAPGEEVWFVGDAAIDIECARNAGCVAVLFGAAAGEADRLQALPPDLRLDELPELVNLVGRS